MQELELALQEEQEAQKGPSEIELQDDSSSNVHEKIAENFRPEVWKKYLDINGKESRVVFSDIYDLPEQNELRNDCKQIVGELSLNFTKIIKFTMVQSYYSFDTNIKCLYNYT